MGLLYVICSCLSFLLVLLLSFQVDGSVAVVVVAVVTWSMVWYGSHGPWYGNGAIYSANILESGCAGVRIDF